MTNAWKWFRTLISGKPHFIIGGPDNPYMRRWHIIPYNRFLCIYLHQFLRDDDDRALHDHPWHFASIMLRGSYDEHTDNGVISRSAPSLAFRTNTHRHRVELKTKDCWTLIIRGPALREWGFWCPQGFVHWKIFTASDDKGQIGRGCGEMDG